MLLRCLAKHVMPHFLTSLSTGHAADASEATTEGDEVCLEEVLPRTVERKSRPEEYSKTFKIAGVTKRGMPQPRKR